MNVHPHVLLFILFYFNILATAHHELEEGGATTDGKAGRGALASAVAEVSVVGVGGSTVPHANACKVGGTAVEHRSVELGARKHSWSWN